MRVKHLNISNEDKIYLRRLLREHFHVKGGDDFEEVIMAEFLLHRSRTLKNIGENTRLKLRGIATAIMQKDLKIKREKTKPCSKNTNEKLKEYWRENGYV